VDAAGLCFGRSCEARQLDRAVAPALELHRAVIRRDGCDLDGLLRELGTDVARFRDGNTNLPLERVRVRDAQRLDAQQPRQGIEGRDIGFDAPDLRQRAAFRRREPKIAQAELAGDVDRGILAGRLREAHRNARVELAAVDLHGQRRRRIPDVGLDLEGVEVERDVSAQRLLERQRLALDVQRSAVHARSEARLDIVLEVARQVRQVGNGDVDVAHLVLLALGPIVEIDASADQADVAEREPGGLRVRRRVLLRAGKTAQDVAHVVVRVAVAHQVHAKAAERDLVGDRGQVVERANAAVDVEPVEGCEHGALVGLEDA